VHLRNIILFMLSLLLIELRKYYDLLSLHHSVKLYLEELINDKYLLFTKLILPLFQLNAIHILQLFVEIVI